MEKGNIWSVGEKKTKKEKGEVLRRKIQVDFSTAGAPVVITTGVCNCIEKIKHRKNCECCPGHHQIVDHYSSI